MGFGVTGYPLLLFFSEKAPCSSTKKRSFTRDVGGPGPAEAGQQQAHAHTRRRGDESGEGSCLQPLEFSQNGSSEHLVLRGKNGDSRILGNKQLNDNQMKSSLRPGLLYDMFSGRDPLLNFHFSLYLGGWWASKDIPLTEDEMAKTVKPKWWSWELNWPHPEN